MAQKRMFSRDIVQSDAFLDMPASTQVLYFHLGMEADDDGFVSNPKKLLKVLGSSDDDMKILIGKRFVILFPSGILVIKHHRINNNWDSYNCKRTAYLEEFSQLYLKQNNAYTLDSSQGVIAQSVIRLKKDFRRDEKKGEEKRKEITDVISSPSEVREVREDSEGQTKAIKKKDNTAMALREKLYDIMLKENGVRPTPNMGDYKQIQKALKHLNAGEVQEILTDAISSKQVPTVRGALTDRAIDIKRAEVI